MGPHIKAPCISYQKQNSAVFFVIRRNQISTFWQKTQFQLSNSESGGHIIAFRIFFLVSLYISLYILYISYLTLVVVSRGLQLSAK